MVNMLSCDDVGLVLDCICDYVVINSVGCRCCYVSARVLDCICRVVVFICYIFDALLQVGCADSGSIFDSYVWGTIRGFGCKFVLFFCTSPFWCMYISVCIL